MIPLLLALLALVVSGWALWGARRAALSAERAAARAVAVERRRQAITEGLPRHPWDES